MATIESSALVPPPGADPSGAAGELLPGVLEEHAETNNVTPAAPHRRARSG